MDKIKITCTREQKDQILEEVHYCVFNQLDCSDVIDCDECFASKNNIDWTITDEQSEGE